MSNLPFNGPRSSNDSPAETAPNRLSVGNIELDLSTFRVSVGTRPTDLSYQEFEMLKYLAGVPDRVVSFSVLSNFLWGTQGQKENRRLNVLVCRLRSKLAESDPYRLETVRGRGYGLLSHDQSEAAQGGGAS
jgi:two-component system, OmpR family, response regulator MtrA